MFAAGELSGVIMDDIEAGVGLRLGLIGAGGFAGFVAGVIATLPQLRVIEVFDVEVAHAAELAAEVGAAVAPDIETLLSRLDGVIIATPPATHAELAVQAAQAGVHVFCEKPLALSDADAAAVETAVEASGVTYVVDHVIRYNPLVRGLVKLRSADVFGAVQRFFFENDAGDSRLGPDHWFWDQQVSGGILLEHAVHFIDVANMLIGSPATQTQAMATERPDSRLDTVVATVRHADGALATHAHGFAHPDHGEHQLMRIDFGRAEARLDGWIPLDLRLEALVDDEGLAVLRAVADDPADWLGVPGHRTLGSRSVDLRVRPADVGEATSRGVTVPAPHHVMLRARLGAESEKHAVYAESVRSALVDFATSISTGAAPSAGVAQGVETIRIATADTRALRSGNTESVSR